MIFEIWEEGYSSTGMRALARKVGEVEGPTFKEAARKLGDEKYGDNDLYWDPDEISLWGCRWYPTELEARRSFG